MTISRGSLVGVVGAAIPTAAAVPSLANTDHVKPRLAALKREHGAAHATRMALTPGLYDDCPEAAFAAEESWEEAMRRENDLALAVMREPVTTLRISPSRSPFGRRPCGTLRRIPTMT